MSSKSCFSGGLRRVRRRHRLGLHAQDRLGQPRATASTTGAATTSPTVAAAIGHDLRYVPPPSPGASGCGCIAVEIRFVVGKISAAFDSQCGSMSGFTAATFSSTIFRRSAAPPIFARCSLRIALRDSRMRLPSTESTFTST